MRILLVHSGSDLYGASRSLLRLAQGLLRTGHAVRVLLPGDGPLRAALQDVGIEVARMETLPLITRRRFASPIGLAGFFVDAWRCARAMRGELDRFQPDLVHTNNTTVLASYGPELIRRGIPHVWHVRESFAEFKALWPWLRRFMLRHADRIVCVSDAVARQFPDRRRVEVIHNGFPVEEFERVTDAHVEAFRSTHGLSGHRAIGISGRLKLRRKGQETFLRAAARLGAEFRDVRFVLIGSPFPGNESHGEALRSLARELGIADRVCFTGDVAEPLAALKSLDVAVLASGLPEPFGGVVVEAMALGRPVIGTAIGGTTEQVVDGETGYLVPPNDPAALSACMEELLRDEALRHRMGEAGRARFRQAFTFDVFLARMETLYQRLARARPDLIPSCFTVIGTPCACTRYAELTVALERHRTTGTTPLALDFTNVHIVTARRLDSDFRALTRAMDYFIPDSRVLCRAIRWLGGPVPECLFGPHFMDRFLRDASPESTHVLLGGSPDCIARLKERYGSRVRIVLAHHGYGEAAQGETVAQQIAALDPDFVWIGLGTPRQQAWIAQHKHRFRHSVLLAVGYAFDVNAGLKSDAPSWMHRAGLVWLYRLCSEPRRLAWRYAFYNTAFLGLLIRQGFFGPAARERAV